MGSSKKSRLDQLLVSLGFVPTRNKAQALIMAGQVLVNNQPVDKVGSLVLADADIRLRGIMPFVSRGGEKLDPAIDEFKIELEGLVTLDIGASTGGFTDVLLKRGVRQVYAVDVGTNQLDDKLRRDPRVVCLEGINAKNLTSEMFSLKPTFAVIDVSFIGLRKLLLAVKNVLQKPYGILALVKPQFELGPEYVEKGGVVKKEADQLLAVKLVRDFGEDLGLNFVGQFKSPILGARKGNQEYLVYFRDGPS